MKRLILAAASGTALGVLCAAVLVWLGPVGTGA